MYSINAADKLIYHYDRVYELLKTGKTNPVHITVGLTNYCNHACTWCYIDFIREEHKKPINADIRKMLEVLQEAHDMGVKAVTLVGDGEPSIHPEFAVFVRGLKKIGLDCGIFTNGGWKKPEVTDALLETMTFVRFSIDAATEKTHKLLHRADDFEKVIANCTELVKRRNSTGTRMPTIGVQFVVNSNNIDEVADAAKMFRKTGVDYIALKPTYVNVLNENHSEKPLDPAEVKTRLDEVAQLATADFKVLWKQWQFDTLVFSPKQSRSYDVCRAVWLSPYIDEDGNVEFCGNLKGRGFTIGNVYKDSFSSIWGGTQHMEALKKIELDKCPAGCKLHGLNVKLNEICCYTNERHENFI